MQRISASPMGAKNLVKGGFWKILIVEDDHLIALDAEAAPRAAGLEIVAIAATAAAAAGRTGSLIDLALNSR